MDMAREWGRLADEQDRATDLRKSNRSPLYLRMLHWWNSNADFVC